MLLSHHYRRVCAVFLCSTIPVSLSQGPYFDFGSFPVPSVTPSTYIPSPSYKTIASYDIPRHNTYKNHISTQTYHKPAVLPIYHKPAPIKTYHKPAPIKTYHKPASPQTYHKPVHINTYHKPQPVYHKPEPTYHVRPTLPPAPVTYPTPGEEKKEVLKYTYKTTAAPVVEEEAAVTEKNEKLEKLRIKEDDTNGNTEASSDDKATTEITTTVAPTTFASTTAGTSKKTLLEKMMEKLKEAQKTKEVIEDSDLIVLKPKEVGEVIEESKAEIMKVDGLRIAEFETKEVNEEV